MKGYQGTRGAAGCVVMVHEHEDGGETMITRRLAPRLDLYRHREAFEWGYNGKGPAQLALALLADATGDDDLALRLHLAFRERVVQNINANPWIITQAGILDAVDHMLDEEKKKPVDAKVH